VVLEDGPTSIVLADGTQQPRGNDLWICLPDGAGLVQEELGIAADATDRTLAGLRSFIRER